jgi:hypothetical protein
MSHENSYISLRLENSDFETSWNLRFSALEPELSSVFWLILPSMLHQAGQFHNQLIQPVLFFANRGHLQALKVRVLIVFCPSQLCGIKDRKIKVGI